MGNEGCNNISQANTLIVNDNNKKKKISFLSAIFIVIGSCIGSGIFFKAGSVLQNSWYSLPIAIITWVLSALAVIAMSLSLLEVTSKKSQNLSMIGWVKNFCPKFLYKTCKNFMFYIYMPLTFFFMPLYSLQALQDAIAGIDPSKNNFNTAHDWIIWSVIGLLISFWFIITSGLSSRMGNIQNWIITSVKFFPLAIIIILGFCIAGIEKNPVIISPTLDPTNSGAETNPYLRFSTMSPGIGMFISFGAVFFAYDGFYFSVGIQSEMKEPKKTSLALVIGLAIVTAIYLLVAISMTIASPSSGTFSSFGSFLSDHNLSWLYCLINVLIAIGILGIINSFAMWSTRFTEDLIALNELPLAYKYINKLNSSKPIVGMVYVLITTIIIYIIFATIGGLTYIPDSYLDELNNSYYDGIGYYSMSRLLAFSDLMANWTAVIAFSYIVAAIIGCFKARKTDKQITKFKFFVPFAIITIILVSLGLLFTTLAPFVDLFLLINPQLQNTNEIIGRTMLIVVLFVYILLMIIPTIFDADSKYYKIFHKKALLSK